MIGSVQVKLNKRYPVLYSACLRVIFECVDYHLRSNHSPVVATKKTKKGMLGEGQIDVAAAKSPNEANGSHTCGQSHKGEGQQTKQRKEGYNSR